MRSQSMRAQRHKKRGVFKEQREGMAAGAEGGRGEQGPAQDEFHRPQQGVGFHSKCTCVPESLLVVLRRSNDL